MAGHQWGPSISVSLHIHTEVTLTSQFIEEIQACVRLTVTVLYLQHALHHKPHEGHINQEGSQENKTPGAFNAAYFFSGSLQV